MAVQMRSALPNDGGVARLPDCLGFRVDTPFGTVGLVEELRRHNGRVAELVVRAGKEGSRLLIFPASDITQVVPATRRVTLRPSFHLVAVEVLSDTARPAATPASSADS
jgi:hypothetical protein